MRGTPLLSPCEMTSSITFCRNRLNRMGPSIEPWRTPRLHVKCYAVPCMFPLGSSWSCCTDLQTLLEVPKRWMRLSRASCGTLSKAFVISTKTSSTRRRRSSGFLILVRTARIACSVGQPFRNPCCVLANLAATVLLSLPTTIGA